MRFRVWLTAPAVVTLAMAGCGCGGGGDMAEGTPKNVDMTKDYSPKVDMPGMSPKAAKEAEKKSAEAAKAAATTPPK